MGRPHNSGELTREDLLRAVANLLRNIAYDEQREANPDMSFCTAMFETEKRLRAKAHALSAAASPCDSLDQHGTRQRFE
jgi:hypothetical protein